MTIMEKLSELKTSSWTHRTVDEIHDNVEEQEEEVSDKEEVPTKCIVMFSVSGLLSSNRSSSITAINFEKRCIFKANKML